MEEPLRPAGPLTFHWFLPTSGDSRDIVGGGHGAAQNSVGQRREPTIGYLTQIARAAEQLGFVAALTPTGSLCEDAWLTTAMLCRTTDRLKFLVAFRPGFYSPTLAAQMGATFQRQSGGRLLVNVVTGGERKEQRSYGDFLEKDDRYARTGEFLAIVRDLWDGKEVDFHGDHLAVEAASLSAPPVPVPLVYFGGSSQAAWLSHPRGLRRDREHVVCAGPEPSPQAARLALSRQGTTLHHRHKWQSGRGVTPPRTRPSAVPGPRPLD